MDTESLNKFGWLHISDFHRGMEGTQDRWSQVYRKFLKDIESHCASTGPLDVVVFSGDLSQSGKEEEFSSVLAMLSDLWRFFDGIGQNPSLFVVPGNHDLIRPSSASPISMAVSHWSEALEQDMFDNAGSYYTSIVNQCFGNYEDFLEQVSRAGIPLINEFRGVLSGDCSGVWSRGDLRIGFVGLNSAWSQIKGGNLKGKLHISARQIDKAVPIAVDTWVEENDFNFLVTHHPANWLTEDSQKIFINEINPLGRFTAHLFGHMHVPVGLLEDFGDAQKKRSFQASSLFGIEFYGEHKVRQHGYNFGQMSPELANLSWWPKKAETRSVAGGWIITPDFSALPEGSSGLAVWPIEGTDRQKKK